MDIIEEHAIKYAQIGWKVLPLWGVKPNGQCECGKPDCQNQGKHPNGLLAPEWLEVATTDINSIKKWFRLYPRSNIGLQTGIHFNAIDFDDIDVRKSMHDLPDTVSQRTMRGEHHLYMIEQIPITNKTKVSEGIDIRGEHGYIVAAPSRTQNGGRYEWIESPFNELPLAKMPSIFIEMINSYSTNKNRIKKHDNSEDLYFGEGSRNNDLHRYLSLVWLNGRLPYEAFLSMANVLNDNIVKPPLPVREVDQIVNSVMHYDGKTKEEWEAEKASELAIQEMFAKKHVDLHKQKALELLAHESMGEAMGPPPDFMPQSGLISSIARYILEQSEWPLERVAISTAICFVASLIGSNYITETGLGPNVLITTLGSSGSGKNHPMSMILKIAQKASCTNLIGGRSIASAPGLIAELVESPTKVFFLDEVGLKLQGGAGDNVNPLKKDILTTILELYSSFNNTFIGVKYADQSKRPQITVDNPCLILYGTSTPDNFFKSLSTEHGIDGWLSRQLVVMAEEFRHKHADPIYKEVPRSLIDKIKQFKNVDIEIDESGHKIPRVVPMVPEVKKAFRDLDDGLTEKMNTDQERSIYSRVKENAIKLALIHAVARNQSNPEIEWEDYNYGSSIALYCANIVMAKLDTDVSSNPIEAQTKLMIKKIGETKWKGITASELFKSFFSLKHRDRQEMIIGLLEMREIVCIEGRYYLSVYETKVKSNKVKQSGQGIYHKEHGKYDQ